MKASEFVVLLVYYFNKQVIDMTDLAKDLEYVISVFTRYYIVSMQNMNLFFNSD